MNTIGKHIARERKRLGLTQMELAVQAKTSINTVSRLELGKVSDPSMSTLRRIAKALGTSIGRMVERG